MKVFRIRLDLSRSGYCDEIEHALWSYLVCLHGATQIANDDYIFVRHGNFLSVEVTCPEDDSLYRPSPVEYTRQMRRKLEEATGFPLFIEQIGDDPQERGYTAAADPVSYILRYGAYSPLLCGRTLEPVPLYRIPPTDPRGESYDDIGNWEHTYKRLYGLWIGSTVGERYAQDQLQRFDSELSVLGRSVCARIERRTGKPTFYFLLNDRRWTTRQDRNRKCPGCGGDWALESDAPHRDIAFRCEPCRLVSERSPSCR